MLQFSKEKIRQVPRPNWPASLNRLVDVRCSFGHGPWGENCYQFDEVKLNQPSDGDFPLTKDPELTGLLSVCRYVLFFDWDKRSGPVGLWICLIPMGPGKQV